MRFFTLLFCSVLLFSCKDKTDAPDVSDIKVDIRVERFEQSFFRIDTANTESGLNEVNRQYPGFLPFYIRQILQVAPASPDLRLILATYRPINDSLQKKYPGMGWLEDELEEGFRYVKYYYPQYKVPSIISFIGTFDAPGIVMTPQYLGIGLHQFAGKSFSVYQDPQLKEMYPAYISRRFDKEYIAPNAIKAVVDDIYPDSSTGRPLIEQMIEKGKQWYLLDLFMPGTPDSLKTGYTGKQVEWLEKNEGNVWGYFTSNVDLYTIDPIIIQDYIGEAPFTRGMPEALAPGNIGQWVGWQMVRKYANEKKLTPQQVLAVPARKIFDEGKYKPK